MIRLVILFLLVTTCLIGYSQTEEKKADESFGWKEGFLGVALGALAGYILKIESDHKKERESWQQVIRDQFKTQSDANEKANVIQREHIGILQGIKSLIEQRK
jgi:hypothetical protein